MRKPNRRSFKGSWVFDYNEVRTVQRRRELQHKIDAKKGNKTERLR